MKLNYEIMGEGVPLFILHGMFGSSSNWKHIASQLANNFKIYLIDLRNHGESPHTPCFDYYMMANDIMEIVIDEDLEKINLMGHSMGGKVAMQYAFTYPKMIQTMIIVDITPKKYPLIHQNLLMQLNQIPLNKINKRQDVENYMNHTVSESVKKFMMKNLVKKHHNWRWKFNLSTLTKYYEILMDQIITSIPIAVPTLFLKGSNSDYIQKEDVALLDKYFMNYQVQEVPNSGHWVHIDNPKVFVEMFLSFVRASH